jgi:predicted nucleic acid-binding protein
MIVIDASVAVKWFLPEEGTEAALNLLEGPRELLAPSLIKLEVAGAITRRVRLGALSLHDGRRQCEAWFQQIGKDTITLVSDEDVIEGAVQLALKIKHTLQDCMYLQVARRLEIPLITADGTFKERAGKIYPKISLLTKTSPR